MGTLNHSESYPMVQGNMTQQQAFFFLIRIDRERFCFIFSRFFEMNAVP